VRLDKCQRAPIPIRTRGPLKQSYLKVAGGQLTLIRPTLGQ